MLVTEKEASQKNCILPDGGNIAAAVQGRATQDCVGCECMGWRWAQGEFEPFLDSDGVIRMRSLGDHRRGYCGLAGKPLECD